MIVEMELETSQRLQAQTLLDLNGKAYKVNIEEIEAFLGHCNKFMEVDNQNEFELLTQEIADTLIDTTKGDVTMEQIRPKLLFLREVGFLLKTIVSPI